MYTLLQNIRIMASTLGKPRFETLQAGRGIAAVLVVIHHAGDYVGADARFWHIPIYKDLFFFGALGVQFFFVLSGAVILLAHWKDIGKPRTALTYVRKRFNRIYPIYWIVLLGILPGVLTHPTRTSHGDPWTIVSSFLLVHICSPETVLNVGWTLFHEVLFYAVFSFLLLSRRLGSLVMGAWLLLSLVQAIQPFGGAIAQANLSYLHLLFAMGMVAAFALKHGIRYGYLAACIIGISSTLYSFFHDVHGPLASCISGVGFALLIYGLATLEQDGKIKVAPWLRFLGDASYSIYLLHFPLLSITMRACFSLDKHVHLPIPVWFVAQIVLVGIVGCLFHVFVERRLLERLAMRKPHDQLDTQNTSLAAQ
ncbi:acyltransferase family protein [Terriglobus albidus]|uniref:acyltransferase family protein n=1 Tax=Terriglobus albidus TaxID=1592106 RepID=UPI0021E019C9|nr:acyltransferase [Terriglobus albidus]